MAVLLLPTVAQARSAGNESRISNTISMAMRYSLYMGILCIGVFCIYGDALGTGVFHDPNAGAYISTLAWLCPFMYLATTMGSILNGMGHTSTTFIQNIVSMILRLAFILFGIPRFGIRAYLWGILASEILLASMNLYSLSRQAEIIWAPAEMIVKPALILILSIGICRAVVSLFPVSPHSFLPDFFCTAIEIALLAALYLLGLGILHIWKNRLP